MPWGNQTLAAVTRRELGELGPMMDSFEFNKIAGAVLSALLVIFGVSTALETFKGHGNPKLVGYEMPKASAATAGGAAAEAGFNPAAVLAAVAKGNVESGQGAFKKCAACHTPDKGGKNGTGPNLWGVVNRAVGSTDGFGYSPVLKGKGGNWSWANLAAYLHDPKGYAPGNKMAFAGVKDATELADLLAYMRTMADAPAELPK
jgi:cytochrome c